MICAVKGSSGYGAACVTALTAANAIRRRLGYADTLAELRRADYYCLDLDVDDPDAALEMVRDMAERTNLFVNPNKHAFTVRLLDERGRAVEDDGTHTVNVLVTDPADASPAGILKSLQEMAAYGDKVQSVRRGVLWTMRLVADSEERARLRHTSSPWYRGYLFVIAFGPMPIVLIGEPVGLNIVYAVVGALFMPFLAATLLYMNNRKRCVGALRNGVVSNALLIATLLLFAYLGVTKLGLSATKLARTLMK